MPGQWQYHDMAYESLKIAASLDKYNVMNHQSCYNVTLCI